MTSSPIVILALTSVPRNAGPTGHYPPDPVAPWCAKMPPISTVGRYELLTKGSALVLLGLYRIFIE
jgi:hypothetical protein